MKAVAGISNFSLPTYYRLPSVVNVVLNVNSASVLQRDAVKAKPASLLELPTAVAKIHTLRDGELVLYRRNRSRVWQCRFKLYDGQWQRISTRKTALEQAAAVACDMYDEARYRVRLGLTAVQKAFADIAKITADELQRDIDAGTGKKIYVDYISIIHRYFIPFFGDKYLHNIKHADIAAFERWRNDKMGRKPKSSTLMNFASAFSRVCATAVQRGWLSDKVPLPKMTRKGEKGTQRPAFNAEEIQQLRVFMGSWHTQGKNDYEQLMRPLLCNYVEMLLLTGMRHGTEAMNIKWRHCEWYENEGVRYLRIWVDGKTGGRWLIAKHEAAAVVGANSKLTTCAN